jgi:glycosyltransferase involved in cell wall biosynthesis
VTTALRAVLEFPGGAEPRIYTAADRPASTPSYLAVRSAGMGLPWYREMRVYLPRLSAFAAALRHDGIDVVHVTTPGPVGLAGRWLATRLGLPLVGSYHTHLGDYATAYSGSARLGRALDRYMRWCYSACDPTFVPSEATRDLLVDRGYPPSRLAIWSRGVDARKFSPARASQSWRDMWHVDASRPAILYVGRLSREKGLDLIGPIRHRLRRHGVDHQFVFVGDGPMRPALAALCPDGVFLGTLPHDRVAVAMASSDLFLFPSTTDTLGNVVLEAQASGLPVIVSDQGGPSQQVLPNVSGVVCPARDDRAFSAAILRLIRAPEERMAMSRAARAYADTRDWPRALEPLLSAWACAAGRRRTVGGQPLLNRTRALPFHGRSAR